MSHWCHTMVDGANCWISYQGLAFLSILSRWQLIQNLAPSTIVRVASMWHLNCPLLFLGLWTSLVRSLVIPWNRGSRKDSYQETLWLDLYCCCCWNLCILWVFDSPEFTRMHLLVPIDTRAMKQPVQKPIFLLWQNLKWQKTSIWKC